MFESPLGLFDPECAWARCWRSDTSIPRPRAAGIASPWAIKRLDECGGDITRFRVVKVYPSRLRPDRHRQDRAGRRQQPGHLRAGRQGRYPQAGKFSQNDPDAYGFSGGLNRANQGILEFVEMFKAPIKMLHPLLTATQEGNYVGTENIGAIPFQGIILAHSNEAEWQSFRNNRTNEAFLDRV